MDDLKRFFYKKKIFITGHTGFKGSWLSSILLCFKANITGYSLNDKKRRDYEKIVDYKKVKNIYGDILDHNKLKRKIIESRSEIIFHFAAQSLVIEGYKNPYKTFLENSNGVLNILEIVRNLSFVKTLIIATSDKCYKIKKNKILREEDELGGEDPYSASKASAEIIFNSYLRLNDYKNKIGLATVRAGNVIGGGDFSKNRIIPDCYKSMKTKKINLRNPKAVRPWQHILDVCRGYLILSKKIYKEPNYFSGSWNLGPKKNSLNVLDLVKKFEKYSKQKFSINVIKQKKYKETSILKLSSYKSEKKLKWKNTLNHEKMISLTAKWYNHYKQNKSGLEITINQIKDFFN